MNRSFQNILGVRLADGTVASLCPLRENFSLIRGVYCRVIIYVAVVTGKDIAEFPHR